jgi:flavin-dependent thymidylate synthase
MVDVEASVVYCSDWPWQKRTIQIPKRMGSPRYDQLKGTEGERLCELAGRVCYDSLGSGRSSEDYHKHIRDVKHYSTIEHHNITVEIQRWKPEYFLHLVNRPGIYVDISQLTEEQTSDMTLHITYNPRVITDWERHGLQSFANDRICKIIKLNLAMMMRVSVPQIISDTQYMVDANLEEYLLQCKRVCPPNEHHDMVTIYMRGSRGFSHEQVRHRFSISQRSTRYVDESQSDWYWHPLVNQILSDPDFDQEAKNNIREACKEVEDRAKNLYSYLTGILQAYILSKGVDRFTARKQARGAARGFLGNALSTEMLFTASLHQWKDMFGLRMTDAADGEIRLVYNRIYEEMVKEELPIKFDTKQARDGIGFVIKE